MAFSAEDEVCTKFASQLTSGPMTDILAPAMGDLTGAELAAKPLPGDPSKPFNPPLSKAAVEGNLEEVKRLLAGRADVNEIDQGWSTPMHRACWTNSLDVAKYLLDAKADLTLVNIVRSPGTPHAFVRLTAALFFVSMLLAGPQDAGGLRQRAGEAGQPRDARAFGRGRAPPPLQGWHAPC